MTNPVVRYIDRRVKAHAHGELRWQVQDHHSGPLQAAVRDRLDPQIEILSLLVSLRTALWHEVGPAARVRAWEDSVMRDALRDAGGDA